VPLPGWDAQHEWIGIVPLEDMPHALNPKSGLIISANHRLLPPEKSKHNLGQMWRNGYRAERIRQLLHSQPTITLADCRRYQLDQLSLPGLQLVGLLADLETDDPDAHLTLDLLRQWDGYLNKESIGGTIFQVLVEQLTTALLPDKVPATLLPHLLGQGLSENLHPINEFQGYWIINLLRILAQVPSPWFDSLATRNKLIIRCLGKTTAVLQQTWGENPAEWQWGRLHTITFQHALGKISSFEQIFSVGPLPLAGDGNTVAQAGMRPGSYACDGVSVSSRLLIDMSAIEQAEAMLAPGQSGHPGSPHYSDLAPMWQRGENFPVLWHGGAIQSATQHTLTLTKRP
jgi:penicillin amidase